MPTAQYPSVKSLMREGRRNWTAPAQKGLELTPEESKALIDSMVQDFVEVQNFKPTKYTGKVTTDYSISSSLNGINRIRKS